MLKETLDTAYLYFNRAKDNYDEIIKHSIDLSIYQDKEKIKTIDAFIFRFIKLQDKLFRIVLKSIGEYKDNMSLIDVLDKLEKLEIVNDTDQWIDFRNTRNKLTHEYSNNQEDVIEGIQLALQQKEDKKYTFSDYFDMNSPTKEIVGEFGYSFALEVLDLPKYTDYDNNFIKNLQKNFYTVFPKISLNSETAKREFLIAPLLLEIARITDVTIHIEYLLDVNDKLSGLLDYFLIANQELIIIEAQKKDVDNGFNQLAAELIALDKYEENDKIEFLYGAVTLGDLWKFGILDRKNKHIIKNIHSHTIPEDTEEVFSMLMGIINVSSDPKISGFGEHGQKV